MNKDETLRHGFDRLRRTLKLKSYQFAEELRCTPEWLSKVMSGKRPISADLQLRALELMNRRGLSPSSIPELAVAPSSEATDAKPGATPPPQSVIVAAEIRRKVEEAISAARGDLLRLGYLREMVDQHLRPPAHWTSADVHDEALRDVIEEEHRGGKRGAA